MSTQTITATITQTGVSEHLVVPVDGELRRFAIRPNWRLNPGQTVHGEAARLLSLYAGYQPTGEWREVSPRVYTADVAVIPGRCATCVHGCECERGSGGCGHFGCWAATDAVANTCSGAAIPVASRRCVTRPTRSRNRRR